MIKFVTFAVKLQLNVHDLNNETVAGNVSDIRIMEFLDEDGNKQEAPAVSGRMLKHWHCEIMRRLILGTKNGSMTLCDACKNGEPVRPAKFKNGKLSQKDVKNEVEIIKCRICDIHGYLVAITSTSMRRSSRVMFSWLMPVSGSVSKQAIHSRVASGIEFEEEEPSQMIFNKSYASGIYAFVSAIDVERIGIIESQIDNEQHSIVNTSEREERAKIAIEAYRELVSAKLGASLSHAIPHNDIKEILVSYSEEGPLPFPISPMYTDYLIKTINLMPNSAKHLYYGSNIPPHQVTKKNDINQLIDELVGKI